MPPKLIVLGLVTALNVGLATLVYLKDPARWVNRAFAIFTLTVAGWTAGTYLGTTYADNPGSLLLGRGAFAMAALMAYALLVFLHVFPASLRLPRTLPMKVFGTLAAALALISVSTPWIVATQALKVEGLRVRYGSLYPIFGIYILACVGYSSLIIFQKIGAARSVERLQLKYLFIGLLVPGLMVTVTNLLIPLAFGTSQFSQYGPLFSFLMIAMIAHAIVRHRLMNIRLFISRSVVLLLAAATAGSVFVALVGLITTTIFVHPQDLPFSIEVALVLLIASLFHPLRRWIQVPLDRYFYREPYDYQRTIREASRKIGSMLDLKSLLGYLCEVIGRTIRPEVVSIYIRKLQGLGYSCMATNRFLENSGALNSGATLSDTSSLITLLSQTRAYFLRDDVTRGKLVSTRDEALRELVEMGGEIALPILHEEQLTGFLLVGPKFSGDPYFSEDIDLLSTLVGQAAIAIRNAQLYQEVAIVNDYVANIVATMESGVVAVDASGKVTLFNPAAERLTGRSAKSVRWGPSSSLPVPLAEALQATLLDGQSRIQPETTIPDGAGRLTPVSYSTYALRDRSGGALGAVTVFSDLTRLKELEGERRRAERLASFGALASGIAHEIKNPLVAIKTFAELLPERFTDEDFREDFSKVVIREIERIDDLVDRLRGLASPSTQPFNSLDLREPIEETFTLLRAQLEQKRIRVNRFYAPALPTITGDPSQLKQLFLNLFMNALEAMDPGGELTLDLRTQYRNGVPLVGVRVADTGSGIPESLLGKIFEPFVTTKPRGSGLGLAICRRITDAHGATIRAENNVGTRGSTIAIEFPVAIATTAVISV